MPAIGLDLHKAHIGGHGVEGMDQGPAFRCGEQPVAGEGIHAETHLRLGIGQGQHFVVFLGEIEIIHGAGNV